jgi:hypothetical protein
MKRAMRRTLTVASSLAARVQLAPEDLMRPTRCLRTWECRMGSPERAPNPVV